MMYSTGLRGILASIVITIAISMLAMLMVFVLTLAPVQAATQQSPYDYGDANEDTGIDMADFGLVKQIVLRYQPFGPSADSMADGDADAADYGFVKQLTLLNSVAYTRYDAAYDFSSGAGSDRWAKCSNISVTPPDLNTTFDTAPAGWTEATSEQYAAIAEAHTSVWTINGASNAALQCKFTVGEEPCAITSVGLTFNGSSEEDGDLLTFWLWDYVDEEWRQIGSGVSLTTLNESHHSEWTEWGTVFEQYVDSGNYMYVLFVNSASGSDLNVNYVRLDIVTPMAGAEPTLTPTTTATAEPTSTLVPTATPTATVEPTVTLVPTATPEPTLTPTPTPTAPACEHVYNYVGVNRSSGPHDAYYCRVRNMPPPRWLYYWFKTEATDAGYLAISASDDSRWQTPDPGRKRHILLTLEMFVDEDPAAISQITLVFEGHGEVDSQFEMWAYNFATGKGERVGDKMVIATGADSTMIRSITGNCGDYINEDGKVIWGVYEKATTSHWFSNGYWVAIDYVELITSRECP